MKYVLLPGVLPSHLNFLNIGQISLTISQTTLVHDPHIFFLLMLNPIKACPHSASNEFEVLCIHGLPYRMEARGIQQLICLPK